MVVYLVETMADCSAASSAEPLVVMSADWMAAYSVDSTADLMAVVSVDCWVDCLVD